MLHGNATPRLPVRDARAARIAELSAEYIDASADRRQEIGAEIAGLINRRIIPLHGS
ncbi:hypothetical protein [Aliishimia ponticola]|uniref:hypothetical protein n=1 Tax=Aliishimia ponticola TaxID=2499833 RepID=UPI001455DF04|nr:hypothetical protein [Aliishimia ponticola]